MRIIIFSFLVLSFSINAHSQMSESSVTLSVDSTMFNPSDSIPVELNLILTFTCDDYSDLGGIQYTIYEMESNIPLLELMFDRASLIASNFLLIDRVVVPLFVYENGKNYKVDLSPFNLEGAFTPPLSYITSY